MSAAELLIKNSIIERCKAERISSQISERVSTNAVTKFRRNQFEGRPSSLVDEALVEARKLNKKKGKR